MTPDTPFFDVADIGGRHSEFGRQPLALLSGSESAADGLDGVRARAFGGQYSPLPALPVAVGSIVLLGPLEQVKGIDTLPIVATVANEFGWNSLVSEDKRYSMGHDAAEPFLGTAEVEFAVTVPNEVFGPLPAFASGFIADVGPKSVDDFGPDLIVFGDEPSKGFIAGDVPIVAGNFGGADETHICSQMDVELYASGGIGNSEKDWERVK